MKKEYLQYKSGKVFNLVFRDVLKNGNLSPVQSKSFFDAYLEDLDCFYIKGNGYDYSGKQVLDKLKENTLLNRLFAEAVGGFVRTDKLKTDVLLRFLHALSKRMYPHNEVPPGFAITEDLWRIKAYEHLLVIASILMEERKFKELREVLTHKFTHIFQSNEVSFYFVEFNQVPVHLVSDKSTNESKRVAEIIVDIASFNHTGDKLITADLLLYYFFNLNYGLFDLPNALINRSYNPWLSYYFLKPFAIAVFMRDISYFDKIKVLFDCETKEDFVNKVKAVKYDKPMAGYNYQRTSDAFVLEKIASR